MKYYLKRIALILLSVIVICAIIYAAAYSVISNAIDDANKKGIELYVSSVRYAYTAYLYKNMAATDNIDELDINISIKVECEYKSIDLSSKVELKGCTIDGSKRKYKYVNGRVDRE